MKFFFLSKLDRDIKVKYVLVYGIYGYNRTGFMIVYYLMRIRGGILGQVRKI